MTEPSHNPLAPLSRTGVTCLYIFVAAVLAYCVFGAFQGRLVLPSKRGSLVLSGWATWLVCIYPIAFAAIVYFRFDPSVELPSSQRRLLTLASGVVAVLALLGSVIFGMRP
jgi:hypothetical protein